MMGRGGVTPDRDCHVAIYAHDVTTTEKKKR